MSHTTLTVSPALYDPLGKRLRWAILASVCANILIWRAAAAIAKHPAHFDLRPVEITRVVIDQKGHKIEKLVNKKQIAKKLLQVHKEIARRKLPRPKPMRVAQTPPEGAHLRVMTAKPDRNAPPPQPDEHTALAGGNAVQGVPIDKQNPGNAVVNPLAVVKPPPTPKSEPPLAPKSDPAPPPKSAPAPQPPPTPDTAPAPAPPPKQVGPTRDAEPSDEVKPEIPDDLKQGNYKSFVRVKVEIDADGAFTPILRTSSGNTEIDRRVLEALKKWKWKPALKDGEAVKSTQLFKFEFEVE